MNYGVRKILSVLNALFLKQLRQKSLKALKKRRLMEDIGIFMDLLFLTMREKSSI
jgi:hypothetical protein